MIHRPSAANGGSDASTIELIFASADRAWPFWRTRNALADDVRQIVQRLAQPAAGLALQ